MTGSRQPQINEELLSAYLDDEVTVEERALVEAAIAADPAIAWQVESLRQTVQLLQALPPLALPRAFTLDTVTAEGQVIKAVTAVQAEPAQPRAVNPRPVAKPTTAEQQNTWWQWLLQIWQGGNLQLRNAAAVAFTLLIVLFASNRLVAPTYLRPPAAIPAPAAKVVLTSNGAVTTSVAMALTTAPIETATTVAETAVATSVSVQPYRVAETPAPSAKQAPGSTATGLSAAKLPPPSGRPGEDTLDISGGHSGSFGDQPGSGGSIASTGTDDSRSLATVSSESAALTQSAPSAAANQVRSASSVTTALTATMAMTATVTVTPTAAAMTATVTVTPTATVTTSTSLSATDQTGSITNTEVLTAAPVPSDGASVTPSPAPALWLVWAEFMVGVCAVVLGGLWWRSREGTHA